MKASKIFPYSESELLRTAALFSKKLSEHHHEIEGSDPALNENFLNQFHEALELSITHPQNKSFDQQTMRLHGEMDQLIQEIKGHVISIKFYFQKTFPHDPRVWEQYGHCEFEKTSHNYFKVQLCITQLLEMIEVKHEELRHAKFPFDTIREVVRLKKTISEKNDEIIDYYEENDTEDAERITKLNDLYHLMQIIDSAVRRYRVAHKGAFKKLLLPKD